MSKNARSPIFETEQGHTRKRQKVTRACDTCKSRKKRCTGHKPCAPCLRVGSECTYDTTYSRGIVVPPSPGPSLPGQTPQQLNHSTPASQPSRLDLSPIRHAESLENATVSSSARHQTTQSAVLTERPFSRVSEIVRYRSSGLPIWSIRKMTFVIISAILCGSLSLVFTRIVHSPSS